MSDETDNKETAKKSNFGHVEIRATRSSKNMIKRKLDALRAYEAIQEAKEFEASYYSII